VSAKNVLRAFLLLQLAALLTTCAPTVERDAPDPHRFAELVPGVSTTNDTIAKLGQPNAYADTGHGRVLLQWWDYYGAHPIHLAIAFRAYDHRMIEVQSVTMP
jgi:hypothetical protein